jgi:hypothetical protein
VHTKESITFTGRAADAADAPIRDLRRDGHRAAWEGYARAAQRSAGGHEGEQAHTEESMRT